MESQRLNEQPFFSSPTFRRWLIILGLVWGLLALLYAFLTLQSRKKEQQLTTSGISMVRTFVEQAGMPLLDQNIQQLRRMLVSLGEQQDVLYAAVVDHKNKIIAYTDAGELLLPGAEIQHPADGVRTWLHKDAMIFSGTILFSSTPIGEIRLALSRAYILRCKKIFNTVAFIALTGFVLTVLLLHGRRLMTQVARWRHRTKSLIDVQLLHCPLCGQDVKNDGTFCQADHNTASGYVFRFTGTLPGRKGSHRIPLSEIGSNPRFAFIKNQMIQQCAQIISKLSINAGAQQPGRGRT